MRWTLFEQLDEVRRFQGAMLELAGFGPLEAPYGRVHQEAGVVLREYQNTHEGGPVVLIVPAPIKRPYLWDLAPEVSAVRRCLSTRRRVFLIDWQAAPPHFGLGDYAERLILSCLDAADAERGILIGHSLGGLFAAIFAALHPERVQALVLLGAPLHFGVDAPVFSGMVRGVDLNRLPEALPGSALSAASFRTAVPIFGMLRWVDAIMSVSDPAALRTHLQVERWTLDELPLPGRLVAELVTLVSEDRFARGTLQLGGHSVLPSRLSAPILCVIDRHCQLVPPESVLPLLRAAGSPDKTVLTYEGDFGVALRHVGPLAGRRAHAFLWPKIVRWIAMRAGR